MDITTYILLLIAFACLFAVSMYLLYIKMNDETKHNMNDLANQYLEVAKNRTPTIKLPYCPSGCERGDCQDGDTCSNFYLPNVSCCKFDLQCRDCVDRRTGNVYYNEGGDTDFIDKNYRSSNPKTIRQLNREIRRQNEYIEDVNQLVSEHNAPLFKQEQIEDEEIREIVDKNLKKMMNNENE